MKAIVSKRDGSKEKYSEDKISRVAIAAGLLPDQAQRVAAKITKWVKKSQPGEVTTLQIRDRLIEELKKIDKSTAELFIWYEKTKERSKDLQSKKL